MKSLTPKRQQLVTLLKKNESLTFDEIEDHFTISEPALRKHIHHLLRNGYIKRRKHLQQIGRPYYTYKLTEQGHRLFSKQDEQLPIELLQDVEELYGQKAVNKVLVKRMTREKNMYKDNSGQGSLERQLENIVQVQNKNGYMAEVRKQQNGKVELVNYHCPIYNLASSYRQICNNEEKMYENLFPDCSVKIESNIVKGDYACKWIITPKREDD